MRNTDEAASILYRHIKQNMGSANKEMLHWFISHRLTDLQMANDSGHFHGPHVDTIFEDICKARGLLPKEGQ